MNSFTNIVDDLIDHITVLKELGERTVEMDLQVVRDLEKKFICTPTPGHVDLQPRTSRGAPEKREPLSRALLQNTKALPYAERKKAMLQLLQEMRHCSSCGLCKIRKNPVIGQGNINSPDIMFIEAAPDRQTDESGNAFSGEAGSLLEKMINAMGYKCEDVFLTGTCKCRTPDDRAPTLDEMKKCSSFLEEQIKIVRPKTIVVMGEHASKGLFHNQRAASKPQGSWTQFHGIPVMTTFHPRYILRFSNDAEGQQKDLKRSTWSALKAVMQLLKR